MADAKRACDFRVSEYLFKLSAEGVRVFSNSVYRHASLGEVINVRADRAGKLAESYETEDLEAHLRIIPADGDIELSIEILETSADFIDAAIPSLEQALGKSVRFIEVMSLMLFDFIAERNTTEVLTKLGMSIQEASEYRIALKRRDSNVIPFR
ncbi:hypothetical protein [Sphingomonas solaris]|uniref:Uncharacterized protein n=1 Tax=Alterirhizorhabdus solaris TaxID=2529389 RepID=A0A558RC64_9SPHN|nr:hypothetical protein [Sphingomonas solaris]TVV76943.1 hypothetical protein FOY91_02545 [Sphingomonas solaris]